MATRMLPATLKEALIEVCGVSFWFKDSLFEIFARSKIPEYLYRPYELRTKFRIARELIVQFENLGDDGQVLFKRLLIELCSLPDLPDSNVSNRDASIGALRRLKREAVVYSQKLENNIRGPETTRRYGPYPSNQQEDRYDRDIRDTAGKPSPRGFRSSLNRGGTKGVGEASGRQLLKMDTSAEYLLGAHKKITHDLHRVEGTIDVEVIGNVTQIAEAIDRFPSYYHADFFEVRAIGHRYMSELHPTNDVAVSLSQALRRVLINWGAGKRKAPGVRSERDFEATFLDPGVHAEFASLPQTKIPDLGLHAMHRRLNGQAISQESLSGLDSKLLILLRTLADRLLVGNTNATYPMKALLLVTGMMPAFDSQVRRGLHRGGFSGMAATRFLLPTRTSSTDGKKITRLPFVLGQCWNTYGERLLEGARQSRFAKLIQEPGRIFDVLLFMQANDGRPISLRCDHDSARWYETY